MIERIIRSESVTMHRNEECDVCKGAAAHHADHYALGRLRTAMGEELGLPRETTQQLDFSTLLARWQAKRHAYAGSR